jgi:hypothetical protein
MTPIVNKNQATTNYTKTKGLNYKTNINQFGNSAKQPINIQK